MNGVFGQGSERHIAHWRTVKSVTVFEVKEKGFKEEHLGDEQRPGQTNKVGEKFKEMKYGAAKDK